ncbi:MAG: iron ABC transporter permease [Nocardioidaceae bacterium]|nr:iron ABC transporter permease [Nocardioidaceae bacterium]
MSGRVAGLAALLVVLVLTCGLSIVLGARDVSWHTLWSAFTAYDDHDTAQRVLREMRIPRTLLGLVVGAALGVAGSLLQGLTRNPLADPGIMGINAGAALAVVSGVMLLGVGSGPASVWLAFLGAAAATAAVYGIASLGRDGATPVKLALAGAALTAGMSAVTTGIVMTHIEALNALRFWQVGSLAGRYLPVFWQVVWFIAGALVVSLVAGRLLNGLALGEDVARGLGMRVGLVRAVLFATVALLCGAATAACGPIVFVGLVVPHVARMLCGPDYRWIVPYSMVIAPVLLLAADVIGRLALGRGELQVGVVLGVLGAPVFVGLVRYRGVAEL